MQQDKFKTIIAFAAIYLVWGSTFMGVSIALKSFPPFLLSALRFLVGGLALLTYSFFRHDPMPSKHELLQFSTWGIVIFGGGVVSVVWAQQYLPSSLASIVITTPFWFVVLDKANWHINLRSGWIISGLLVGLAGVLLLLSQQRSSQIATVSFTQVRAILVMIAGSFLWVSGSLNLRNKQYRATVYSKTAVHLLAASLFTLLVSIVTGEFKNMHWNHIHAEGIVALLLLALVSTTATFLAYVWLIGKKPVGVVSTYSYVNPLVAVLLGVFIGRESITGLQLLAMLIILSGVLFVNIPKYKS